MKYHFRNKDYYIAVSIRPKKMEENLEKEDDITRMPMWKSYLYHLQQQAPKPKRIVCQREVPNKPPYYGREYHGAISREDTDFLLTIGGEGSYLIRESQRAPGQYTLAIRFEMVTKNFKLYYDGQHYVGEKRFDTVQDLVADGLITFYLEAKASDYIAQLSNQSNYAESPYVAYNTLKKKQLAAPRSLSRSLRSKHQHHRGQGESKAQGERSEKSKTERSDVVERNDRDERSPSAGADVVKTRKSAVNIPVEGRVSQILENRQDANQIINIAKDSHVQSSQVGVKLVRDQQPAGVKGQQPVTPQSARSKPQSHLTSPGPEVRHPPSPKAPAQQTDDSHEYVNQSQINLHRQTRLDADQVARQQPPPPKVTQQQQSPKASPNHIQKKHGGVDNSESSHNAQKAAVRQTHIGHMSPGHEAVDRSPLTPDEDTPEGRVTSSTNTDGPTERRRQSAPSKFDVENQKQALMEQKKRHNFKMFEEPHFTTPPSSPIPLHALDHLKFSNVSWCTDFLEVLGCEKPHNFKQTTFKGPHWCDFCANFLWGLIAQGVKCQDCGFNAHKKCSEKVPNDCMPDMKYVKRMFGVDLTTLVKAQNTLIPVVVEKCVTEIERRGVESEGLYRVAGFHDDVEAIKMSFDKDADLTDISEERYDDINTITSLLKLYFRLLPIPLITFDIYFKLVDIVKCSNMNHDQILEQLRHLCSLLAPAHYHTLKYLMAHLSRVSEKQSKNMMSPENLAIVFAPTLLRSPENDPLSGLTAVKYERELIELIITHQSTLFD